MFAICETKNDDKIAIKSALGHKVLRIAAEMQLQLLSVLSS